MFSEWKKKCNAIAQRASVDAFQYIVRSRGEIWMKKMLLGGMWFRTHSAATLNWTLILSYICFVVFLSRLFFPRVGCVIHHSHISPDTRVSSAQCAKIHPISNLHWMLSFWLSLVYILGFFVRLLHFIVSASDLNSQFLILFSSVLFFITHKNMYTYKQI